MRMKADKFHRLVLEAARRADGSKWVACLGAFYSPNYTELARQLKVDKGTVSRWASAYTMYRYIRDNVAGCNFELRRVRQALSYLHFYTLNTLMKKYEFSPYQALDYLIDTEHAGYTVQQMAVEVEAQETGRMSGRYGDWLKFGVWLKDLAGKLQNGRVPGSLPEEYQERARWIGAEAETLSDQVRQYVERIER